jgi:uncharacterized protein YkuJ
MFIISLLICNKITPPLTHALTLIRLKNRALYDEIDLIIIFIYFLIFYSNKLF